MEQGKIWQVIKHSPTALAGVIVGAVLMYGASQFPVFFEANWGTEQSYIRFDNRIERWCEAMNVTE